MQITRMLKKTVRKTPLQMRRQNLTQVLWTVTKVPRAVSAKLLAWIPMRAQTRPKKLILNATVNKGAKCGREY